MKFWTYSPKETYWRIRRRINLDFRTKIRLWTSRQQVQRVLFSSSPQYRKRQIFWPLLNLPSFQTLHFKASRSFNQGKRRNEKSRWLCKRKYPDWPCVGKSRNRSWKYRVWFRRTMGSRVWLSWFHLVRNLMSFGNICAIRWILRMMENVGMITRTD